MEEGGTARTTSEAVVIAVTATSMDSSGRSRRLGSIVLRLVLHVVRLDNDRRVVPTTFMINYSQLPARLFDHCLAFYEMKYIGQTL